VQNWRLRKKEIGVEIRCIEKRCTRQPVLTAERNVKSPSSQTAPDQYTAESATQNEDHQDGSRLGLTCVVTNYLFLFCLNHLLKVYSKLISRSFN